MKKRLRVTMILDVEDMTPEEQIEAEVDPNELATLDDYDAFDFKEVIGCIGNPDLSSEFFGGSMIFAKFTRCAIEELEWIGAPR